MLRRIATVISVIMICTFVLAACAPAAPAMEQPSVQNVAPPAPAKPQPTMAPPPKPAASTDSSSVTYAGTSAEPANGSMIIKNAELDLTVEDTDIAVDRITQVVGDVNGYILSSKTWMDTSYGNNRKLATISIRVPVDEFEVALRRIRSIAIIINNENASGEDVSEEYVDLLSNLDTLQATRERIKGFLLNATTVDEALKVNDQLTNVDKQIDEIKGKMKFLSEKASFSTITITIYPKIIERTSTPTNTRTPTATATPWNPGATINKAGKSLGSAYKDMVDAFIWIVVYLIPIMLPFVLVIGGIIWLVTRNKRKKPSVQTPPEVIEAKKK